MAPEIVSRVEYLGPPADIWAAGVLMFCLLNGYFPFKGQTDAELYRRIQRGHYKMIRDDLTDDCLNLLKCILNVNSNTRISATEVLQDSWFATDSRKKRSHDEILQQFKQRMLKQPAKRKPTTTIFIPGTTSSSGQTNQICNESD
jgi:MAP/microtubule affinity-regulating kinase